MNYSMENTPLHLQIESYLFFKGEPVSIKKLAKTFGKKTEDINESLSQLKMSLEGRGVVLMQLDDEKVSLGTHPQMSEFFKEIRKEELSKDLSKPSLETLSIVLYKKDVTRADIDYIRGVNSSFILRNLSVRGLVERESHKDDSRKYVYKPSLELLSFLGVTNRLDLPRFEEVQNKLEDKVNGEDREDGLDQKIEESADVSAKEQ
jgi:segregation and condensation protein B